MQKYTLSGGVSPFGCWVLMTGYDRDGHYKDGLSIDDRLGIIISTLREVYDGVVQAHYMNFIVDIINCMLKLLGEKRRSPKISYDIKKKKSIRKILKHLKKRNYIKFFFLILALNLQDLK